MKNTKKGAAFIAAAALTLSLGAFGTIAWLTDTTDPVQNVFTVGNVKIDLTETTTDYKMVPGVDIAKDPTVTVLANSEDAWVFVKVEQSTGFENYLSYAIDQGWTALAGEPGVFWREVPASATNQTFPVLVGNKATVLDSVTNDMMDAISNGTVQAPTLTFTAYAIQKSGFADAAAAWAELS